jgi:CheY-like chemotaxis protein
VVDDDLGMRETLGECLQSEGYGCWLEASRESALRRLERSSRAPDAILLDLRMPGMSTERFLAELRSKPLLARTPVILTTAAAAHEVPQELPVDALLLRPFDIQRLLDLLRDVRRPLP